MNSSKTILNCNNLTIGYKDKQVLSSLNLSLKKGQLTCLLGPNGSGKSTLIRSLTGIQKPIAGSVFIEERPLESISQKEMARKLSLVLTDKVAPGNLTVYALVSLGRFPYTSWMGSLGNSDKDLIHWAMDVTGTLKFANRNIGELSDGERQKVMIARALVQDTDIIILDEPTAHLDSPNRIGIFHLLQKLTDETNKTILVSTHEIDMAIDHSEHMWLVTKNKNIEAGLPEDLVLHGALEEAFGSEELTFDYTKGRFIKNQDKGTPKFHITGNPAYVKWTLSALDKLAFTSRQQQYINVLEESGNPVWTISAGKKTFNSIALLIKQLEIDDNEH